MASKLEIKSVSNILSDDTRPLKERFRALFTLKNIGGTECIDAISSCFTDSSSLLKHELAYCLGQMGDEYAIPKLSEILSDVNQEPMVRHEAGEALGAIGGDSCIEILKKYKDDQIVEVAQTCQLALDRLQWIKDNKNSSDCLSKSDFTSIDPAPPSSEVDIEILRNQLVDENLSLFERYRAMFSLRNLNTPKSAAALIDGFKASGALFKHEISFVLGQMSCEDEYVVLNLGKVVENKDENEMVRHEAAEALGSIATEDAMTILREHMKDDIRVVRESCEIALDISDYERSKDFQYAYELQKIRVNKIDTI